MSNLISFDVLNQFAKSFESKAVWQHLSNAIPSVTIDGNNASLVKDKYGYQVRLVSTDASGKKQYFFAEVLKENIPAAANNFPNWKIDVYQASRSYEAVALTNGEILELKDYEAKKAELDLLGVTIDVNTRKDEGKISIKAYDPNVPIEQQKESIKLFAVALLS